MKRLFLAVAAAFVCCPAGAMAQSESDQPYIVAGGPWHGPAVLCAPATVTSVGPRLEEPKGQYSSGVRVSFDIPSKPHWLSNATFRTASVVHYQDSAGNAVMQKARPGDPVQVCLVSFPIPTHDPKTGAVMCDPNADPRGFVFRIYAYRQHAAYMGPNSQHGCGGA
jgi:hypothetical protein